MKANIHPKYQKAQVVCSCGNTFTVSSTKEYIHIDLCNKCHPFYTGQQRFVDTASRIEKFQKKVASARPKKVKTEEKKEDQKPLTLREMLQSIKK